MAIQRQINVQFPLGGMNRRGAYRQQKPYTTPDCLNVRAIGTIEGRERGGSRPGLVESHIDDLGDPVRLLEPMTLALGDGFTAFTDAFDGSAIASVWSQASWATHKPSILPSASVSVDTSIDAGEMVLDALTVDTSKTYTAEAFIVPWNDSIHGKYRVYCRMNDTTPDIETDGVMVELVMTGSAGAYSGTLRSVIGGVATDYTITSGSLGAARSGWLSVQVAGNTITVYWCGVSLITQTISAHAGTRVGLGMECTIDGGVCLANVFRVQYYSTGTVDALRTVLVASAGGDLYKESSYGRMAKVTSSLSVRDDVSLTAAQSGQKLYIADYGDVVASGTDGTVSGANLDATGVSDWTALGINKNDMVVVVSNPQGTAVAGTYKISTVAAGNITLASSAGSGACAYRIERAPKVYNPFTNAISTLTATDGVGQVPTGCPLACRYLDRLVLAGAEIAPHVWYMSRQANPEDWDYSQEDTQAAVAGTSSEAGVPGSPIVALIPQSDDYLIFGCWSSLWRLSGDPRSGGSLNPISHTVGIISANAWCHGPSGELVFLSQDGLYALAAGGDTYPIPLSETSLPRELHGSSLKGVNVSLEFDTQGRGVHIFLTAESSNSCTHWWMDWSNKTFWPVSLTANHEPTATCAVDSFSSQESSVILGGRDGILRRFNDLVERDCGEAFSSYVVMGPMACFKSAQTGRLLSLDAVMAEGSGPVAWALGSAMTFEGAINADAVYTGTWNAGLNAAVHPACHAQAFALTLTGTAGRKWAVEEITATVRDSGKRRMA